MDDFKGLEALKKHYHIGLIIEQEENRIIWYEYINSKIRKSAILTQNIIEVYDHSGLLIETFPTEQGSIRFMQSEYMKIMNRLVSKIKYLKNMLRKYEELNKIKNGAYNWRSQAIEAQIEALEELRDDSEDCWDLCYEEDKREAGL